MKTLELKPLENRDEYADQVFKLIESTLYWSVFAPILAILGGKVARRDNAKPLTLAESLISGRVRFQDGCFLGQFSAGVSTELRSIGAKWDQKRKGFSLKQDKLTPELRHAIAVAGHEISDKVAAIKKTLADIKSAPVIDFSPFSEKTVERLQIQLKKITPEDIEIPVDMNKDRAQVIHREYTDNLNLAIQGWIPEAVAELRERVEENVTQGFRADKLASMIQAQYGVSRRKAKFLSLQETSLLVSKYRQDRYTSAGVEKYKWSTSHDVRVRKDHKDLNGQVFSWSNPPITDKARGARNNPGEDYGCRCIAIPLLTVS